MKLNKLISSVIALLIIFTSVFPVYAQTVNSGDTGYVDIQNYCVRGANSYSADNSGAYLYTRLAGTQTYLRMMYLSETHGGAPIKDDNGNIQWVYCIEFGTDINSYMERTAGEASGDSYWNSLNQEQKSGLQLATMYGFPASNLGASAADAYAATQAVIWEFQTGIRSSVASDVKHDVTYRGVSLEAERMTNMLGSDSGGLKAYNNLIGKIYTHSLMPSFSSEEVHLKYDKSAKVYKAELTDTNQILSNCTFQVDDARVKAVSNGNTLTLTSDEVVDGVKLTFSKNVSRSVPQSLILLSASGSQASLLGQSVVRQTSEITVTADNNSKFQNIAVYKKGEIFKGFEYNEAENAYTAIFEYGYLDGCVADVFAAEDIITSDGVLRYEKDELVDTLTTSSQGPVYSKDLYEGEYYIRENTAPEGYKKLTEDIPISLFDDEEIVLENERIRVELAFSKHLIGSEDKTADELAELLSEVSFGVYNSDEIFDLKPDTLLGVIKADENGNFILNMDLPYGYGFYIKELTTADGYTLSDEKFPIEMAVSDDGDGEVVWSVNAGEAIPNEAVPPVKVEREPTTPKTETPRVPEANQPNTGDENGKVLAFYASAALISLFALAIISKKL